MRARFGEGEVGRRHCFATVEGLHVAGLGARFHLPYHWLRTGLFLAAQLAVAARVLAPSVVAVVLGEGQSGGLVHLH